MRTKLLAILISVGLLISLIVAAAPPLATPARAATWYVNPGESIQAAVDAASPGDTIIVRDGTYTENVDVTKAVTIQSEHSATLTIVEPSDPLDHVFHVTADWVNIQGLTARNANGWTWLPSGICLSNVSHCTIVGNTLANNLAGIQLENSTANTLSGNVLSLNWYYGVRLAGSDSNTISGNVFSNNTYWGIDLGGTQNVVTGNIFTNDGLFVGARQNTVQANTVNGKRLVYLEGVSGVTVTGDDVGQVILVDCDHITVEGLTLDRTTVGIQLWNTTNSTVQNNSVSWGTYAIHLGQSTGNVLTKNCPNAYYGIFLANASQNTITENNVINSAYGIGSWQSTSNLIYLNNFRSMYGDYAEENICNSPEKLIYSHSGRSYRNYLGNYWSQYSGSDSNGDGIGDTPYPIKALIGTGWSISGQDNYPLMEPFENYKRTVPVPPATKLTLPFKGTWVLTQSFASYLTEYAGRTYNGYHPGEDWSFQGNIGQARIYSIGSGVVKKIQNKGELGYWIIIEHTGSFTIPGKTETIHGETYQYPTEIVTKIYSVYGHVTPRPGLKEGQTVGAGEQIATLANIAHPHLHFEIRHPNQTHSADWTLVGSPDNWQVFPDTGKYNGYYKHVQPMVDGGVRHPSEFLAANQ